MAFPSTSVLDNFNAGGSQNLTARAGWGGSAFLTTGTSFATDATPTFASPASGGTAVGGNNWGQLLWGDMEAYVTLKAWSPVTDSCIICARIQSFGASPTHYGVQLATSGSTDFQIVKFVSGTRTALGTNTTTATASGDSIGIDVIGTQIRSYYKAGAGAWTLKDTVTDTAIAGLGAIGFRHTLTVAIQIDDFGGGSLDNALSAPRQQMVPFTRGAGDGGRI